MMHRDPALTKLARDRNCTLRIPGVCNGDHDTTVWAHSNLHRHGKGRGLKAHDIFGCFACSACHRWLDQGPASRAEKLAAFRDAHEETLLILVTEGSLAVPGAHRQRPPAAQLASKVVPRGERIV